MKPRSLAFIFWLLFNTQGSAHEEPAFVDLIEDDYALLVINEHTLTVPIESLPTNACAGSWISLSRKEIVEAPKSKADEIRVKLAKDDPGGPIKL